VRDLSHADVGIGEHCLGGLDVVPREFWRTASSAARAPRGGKARLGAFPDQPSLEFRQRSKHMKKKPSLRGRRVDGFGQAAKTDADSGRSSDTADDPRVDPEQAEQSVEEVCKATRREALYRGYRRWSPHGARSRRVAEG
jgi:hypothetical protein